MEFTTTLKKDLKVKSFEKETDKAVYVSVTRSIKADSCDKDLNRITGYYLFNDKMWIPKSQINDNVVSNWFAEKNDIVTIN
jgi:hypothetical protein